MPKQPRLFIKITVLSPRDVHTDLNAHSPRYPLIRLGRLFPYIPPCLSFSNSIFSISSFKSEVLVFFTFAWSELL